MPIHYIRDSQNGPVKGYASATRPALRVSTSGRSVTKSDHVKRMSQMFSNVISSNVTKPIVTAQPKPEAIVDLPPVLTPDNLVPRGRSVFELSKSRQSKLHSPFPDVVNFDSEGELFDDTDDEALSLLAPVATFGVAQKIRLLRLNSSSKLEPSPEIISSKPSITSLQDSVLPIQHTIYTQPSFPLVRPTKSRSTREKVHVHLPLYIYPNPGCWDPLYASIAAHPSVHFDIVINPNSGPGPKGSLPDPEYTKGITILNQFENVTLYGYVHVTWTERDFEDACEDVKTYAGWNKYSSKLRAQTFNSSSTSFLHSDTESEGESGVDDSEEDCPSLYPSSISSSSYSSTPTTLSPTSAITPLSSSSSSFSTSPPVPNITITGIFIDQAPWPVSGLSYISSLSSFIHQTLSPTIPAKNVVKIWSNPGCPVSRQYYEHADIITCFENVFDVWGGMNYMPDPEPTSPIANTNRLSSEDDDVVTEERKNGWRRRATLRGGGSDVSGPVKGFEGGEKEVGRSGVMVLSMPAGPAFSTSETTVGVFEDERVEECKMEILIRQAREQGLHGVFLSREKGYEAFGDRWGEFIAAVDRSG